MKSLRPILAVLLVGLVPALAISAPDTTTTIRPAPPSSRLPFAPGEELRFAVKYGVVRAGNAVMAVEAVQPVGGEAAYRFVSTALTTRRGWPSTRTARRRRSSPEPRMS